jgi:hypothetical protein
MAKRLFSMHHVKVTEREWNYSSAIRQTLLHIEIMNKERTFMSVFQPLIWTFTFRMGLTLPHVTITGAIQWKDRIVGLNTHAKWRSL